MAVPWKDKRQIGDATLYLGDCLEILPHLPKVDAVITDPPYNVSLGSAPHAVRQLGYVGQSDCLDNVQYRAVLSGCLRLIDLGVLTIVTPGNSNQTLWPKPKWTMAWTKSNGVTRTPLTVGQKMNHACWEPILIYGKLSNPPHSDVINLPIALQPDAEGHPCPKPLRLFTMLLSFTKAEATLDPFMGSGTTGVACANLNRKFIGIEIEPKYFDIACKRIETAYRQPDGLFYGKQTRKKIKPRGLIK